MTRTQEQSLTFNPREASRLAELFGPRFREEDAEPSKGEDRTAGL